VGIESGVNELVPPVSLVKMYITLRVCAARACAVAGCRSSRSVGIESGVNELAVPPVSLSLVKTYHFA